jgi:hypothetical protein
MKAKAKAVARPKFDRRTLWLLSALTAAMLIAAAWLSQAHAGSDLVVDFTDYQANRGSVDSWLASKGFKFERDAKSREKIMLRADGRGLEVQALQHAQGLLINQSVGQAAFNSVEIEWGVAQHPQGASYERKVNNEAIMVQFFFGSDKQPSGGMFAPDLPYFIGLFLCNGDKVGFPYVGRYYQAGGRYVCVQSGPAGQALVSRFDLRQGFQSIFGTLARAVTGYSIEVDTTAAQGPGTSSAFIKRIHFLG